jgi:hypothetical protein
MDQRCVAQPTENGAQLVGRAMGLLRTLDNLQFTGNSIR